MTGSADHLRSALAGRYTIERELGRGGAAVVYLAHDLKHDRKVAIKVLNPELALAVRTERFFREIQLTAKLTHPHILTLIDSGQAGESLFYVMPFIAGESLRDRLNREKQLPIADALQIARDMAEALGYAHKQGVIHRDIKPENVMLHAGHAVVMDFGIARALTVAGGQTVTESGVAIGTPAYMSPEQASGGEVDSRSDLYSLGCVLYEVLTGHPPFTGATAQEILGRHALDPVPSLRAARPGIPATVEAVVARALAKSPADRFANAEVFRAAFSATPVAPGRRGRRLVPAGVAVLTLVLALLLAWRWYTPSVDRSIALVPFTNLTTDSADAYFSAGMTDEIGNALAHVKGLRVVPVTPQYIATHTNTTSPQQFRRELGISRVLEGSVRRSGTRLRLFARLLDASDGSTIWSEQFDRELKDVFAVQEGLALAVVAALEPRLASAGGASTSLVKRHTDNTEAYELYLKGRYYVDQRGASPKAREYFTAAIQADSTYALAYSGLADTYWAPTTREALSAMKSASLRAVALDSNLAEAHCSLATVLENEWDWAGAEREYRRAIALNPTYAWALLMYALGPLGMERRWDEAVREVREYLRLQPLNASAYPGRVLLQAGRDDEAIAALQKAVEFNPGYWPSRASLGEAYLVKGRFREAVEQLERSRDLNSGSYQTVGKDFRTQAVNQSPNTIGRLAYAYARSGRRKEAMDLLEGLERQQSTSRFVAVSAAIAAVGLGDTERAWRALVHVTDGEWGLPDIHNPLLAPLRQDPRFKQILFKLGVPGGG